MIYVEMSCVAGGTTRDFPVAASRSQPNCAAPICPARFASGQKILFCSCSVLSPRSHFVLRSLNTRFYSNSRSSRPPGGQASYVLTPTLSKDAVSIRYRYTTAKPSIPSLVLLLCRITAGQGNLYHCILARSFSVVSTLFFPRNAGVWVNSCVFFILSVGASYIHASLWSRD